MRTYTYNIPVPLYPTFEKAANKVGRRAKKFGIDFSFALKGEGVETINMPQQGSVPVDVKKVEIRGPDHIEIEGWRLIARASKEETGHVVTCLDGTNHRYIFEGTICQHCSTNRRRNNVYLLENTRSKEHIQVGSTCLKDFLGHTFAAQLADAFGDLTYFLLNFVREHFDVDGESTKESLSRAHSWVNNHLPINVLEFLAVVYDIVLSEGWTPARTTSSRGLPSTAELAFDWYYGDGERSMVTREVEEIYQWILNPEDPNDNYRANLKVLATSRYIDRKHLGLLASAVPAHYKFKKEEERKARARESEWVGEEGKRMTREVTLKTFSYYYTPSYTWPYDDEEAVRYVFEDAENRANTLIWFTKSRKLEDLKGQTFFIKAMVKKHDVYKGQKQTILNRVTLV